MINESLYKVFGNQNYDKLETCKVTAQLSTIGLLSITPVLTIINPALGAIIAGTGALSAATTYYCSETRIEMYSKEVLEIKRLYEEIIKDYGKLNIDLKLENPVEIYTLFNYALRHGYLSKDKSFKEYNTFSRLKTILGVYPITGEGVCRHIAITLKDVLKASGIESNTLIVFQRPLTKEEIKTMIVKNANEKFKNLNVPENAKIELVTRYVLQELEKLNIVEKENNKAEKKYGNHVVTVAVKNGKLHLLDSTQERIYKLDKEKTTLISDFQSNTETRIIKKTFFGTKNEYKNVKKQIKLPQTSIEEDENEIKKTIVLAHECDDLLEYFYKIHKDAYEEIYQKTKKIEG